MCANLSTERSLTGAGPQRPGEFGELGPGLGGGGGGQTWVRKGHRSPTYTCERWPTLQAGPQVPNTNACWRVQVVPRRAACAPAQRVAFSGDAPRAVAPGPRHCARHRAGGPASPPRDRRAVRSAVQQLRGGAPNQNWPVDGGRECDCWSGGGGGVALKRGGGSEGVGAAMRQRILGSHTPPCHRRMVITTQFNVLHCCTAAQSSSVPRGWGRGGGGGGGSGDPDLLEAPKAPENFLA